MNNNFAQLSTYLRFICRRERLSSGIWIVCIIGLSTMFTALYPDLLPTQAEVVQMAATMNNPAMVAMMGKVYGIDNPTQASMMAQECLIWFSITAATMNIFLINRHSRADEELGRLEMIRALPVGRLTSSFATILFAFIINMMISILTAILLIILNIGGTTILGALVYGFTIGAVGFVFAALTLFLAQLFATAHGVSGAAFSLLGLFYIMRALGDVGDNVLSVISPLGLGLKVEAFYNNNVYVIITLLIESIFITVIALIICTVRDHGAGLIPVKKGRTNASRLLCSPFGLAWMLSKGTVYGWGVGIFILGVSYGSVSSNINDFVDNNEMMQKVIGSTGTNTLLDNYVAMIFAIISMIASVPVVVTAMKIYSEEKRGRLEQLLGRAVPRIKLYGGFIAVAMMESVIMETLLALGLGVASGGQLQMLELLKTGLIYLPAIWVMAGLAILLVGALPKLTSLVWAVFGYSFIVMYMGKILDLPEWTVKITPFGSVPQLPVEEFTAVPLLLLTLIAVLFAVIGLWRYKERDMG